MKMIRDEVMWLKDPASVTHKKWAEKIIERIYKYNSERNLLDRFSCTQEAIFQYEERLEGLQAIKKGDYVGYIDALIDELVFNVGSWFKFYSLHRVAHFPEQPKKFLSAYLLFDDTHLKAVLNYDNKYKTCQLMQLPTSFNALVNIIRPFKDNDTLETLDIVYTLIEIVLTANETKGQEKDATGKNIKGDKFVPPEEAMRSYLKIQGLEGLL